MLVIDAWLLALADMAMEGSGQQLFRFLLEQLGQS